MTPVELKRMIVQCLRGQESLKATLAAVDECFDSQHDGKPIVSRSAVSILDQVKVSCRIENNRIIIDLSA